MERFQTIQALEYIREHSLFDLMNVLTSLSSAVVSSCFFLPSHLSPSQRLLYCNYCDYVYFPNLVLFHFIQLVAQFAPPTACWEIPTLPPTDSIKSQPDDGLG